MARKVFLLLDEAGQRLGSLKAIKQQWTVGDTLVVRGQPYDVRALVPLDAADDSEAAAILVVRPVRARETDSPPASGTARESPIG